MGDIVERSTQAPNLSEPMEMDAIKLESFPMVPHDSVKDVNLHFKLLFNLYLITTIADKTKSRKKYFCFNNAK